MLINIDTVKQSLLHCAADKPCKDCPYCVTGADCQEILMKAAADIIGTVVAPRIQAIMESEE